MILKNFEKIQSMTYDLVQREPKIFEKKFDGKQSIFSAILFMFDCLFKSDLLSFSKNDSSAIFCLEFKDIFLFVSQIICLINYFQYFLFHQKSQ